MKLSKERKAEILVEMYLDGKKEEVAKRHGITTRTLLNYQNELTKDPVLSEIFEAKKRIASEGWAEEVPAAMRASVKYLKRAADECSPTDPDCIHSVAGSLQILSRVASTWKVLDMRMSAMKNRTQPDQASNVTPLRRPG
jgi:hypothetical protein